MLIYCGDGTSDFGLGLSDGEMSAAPQALLSCGPAARPPKEAPRPTRWISLPDLVSQKTNGKVKVINLYTALGVEQQLIQQVMTGSVDIGTISNGNVSRWTTALHPYDLPFLFTSNNVAADSMSTPVAAKAIVQGGKRYRGQIPVRHESRFGPRYSNPEQTSSCTGRYQRSENSRR